MSTAIDLLIASTEAGRIRLNTTRHQRLKTRHILFRLVNLGFRAETEDIDIFFLPLSRAYSLYADNGSRIQPSTTLCNRTHDESISILTLANSELQLVERE